MTIALLALGTGANTALFSVVDTVLLKPLPYADAGRLTSIYEASPAKDQKQSLIAPARIEDWNRMSRAFAAIAGAYSENVTDTSGSEPVRLAGRRVSPRYFKVFQSRPVLGRTFTSDEEIAGGRTAAVISYGLWTRSYGQSREVIQRRLTIGGQGYGIVGVMPQDFSASAIDVWIPAQTPAFLMRARDARFYAGVGRMKAGITVAQAQEDLARVQRVLGEQFPKTDRGWSAQVQDLKEARVGGSRRALLLLFGAVGLLMLITITNVASLFLAELGKRERELAIRTSIGASRGQVIGEVMRETMLLAITGGLVGWGAAVLSLAALKKLFADIPRIEELHVDWRPLLFAVAMSVICAILFGLMPAWRATSAKHGGNLFRAGRGITGERQKLQRAMVVSQIAITLVLLASAGMLLRSFNNLSHVEMGFDASQAVTFHVGAAWDEDRARVGRLQERLIAGLQKIPGVTAAGMTNFLPASGATLRFTFQVDGKQGEQLGVRTVSPGYLQALRVPLLSGAPCPELRYDQKAPQKAMVNRTFRTIYGEAQRVAGAEIVGVIGDMREDALNAPAYPYVYTCAMAGNWPDPEYVVRSSGDARRAIRKVVSDLDPTRAVFGYKTLREAVEADLEQPRSTAETITVFGIAAMLLAAVGLYGLVTQMVNARRKEVGVRMALGADPARILWSVVGGAGAMVLVGIGAGLGLVLCAQSWLRAELYGVREVDGLSLAGAAGLLGAVGILAALVPARRAAAIDPVEAIRAE